MFMFPEPPPVNYYIADVAPCFLSDGIFFHGRPSPTHKCIAKQLKPIKRTLKDPVAPIEELDPRTLNTWLEKEKEEYVDRCGRDGPTIHETLNFMPKQNQRQTMRQSLISIFPRSSQYELWYIRNRRIENFEKRNFAGVKCAKTEETMKSNDESCSIPKPPLWWKAEAGEPKSLPVQTFDEDNTKISEKLDMNHPRKYVPDENHRIKHPEGASARNVLDRADSCKTILKNVETSPKNTPTVNECSPQNCLHMLMSKDTSEDRKTQNAYGTRFDNDRRWQSLCETISSPGTHEEREEELRKLTKPFLHDLHTWYSRNKPTNITLPVKYKGKRPILERRFSHF